LLLFLLHAYYVYFSTDLEVPLTRLTFLFAIGNPFAQ
jgi:hypothetical protein